VRESVLGLMDTALPAEDINTIQKILDLHCQKDIQCHALRTRQAGSRALYHSMSLSLAIGQLIADINSWNIWRMISGLH